MANFSTLVCVIVAVVAAASAEMDYSCVPGATSLGTTVPRGTIVLPVGSDLEIYCHLNPNLDRTRGKNSSDMSFYRNQDELHRPLVTPVNSTSIRLFISNMSYSHDSYTCKIKMEDRTEGICRNDVKVAKLPEEVSQFQCVSENWENLKCSWKKPENTIKTDYNLMFRRMRSRVIHRNSCGKPSDEMCTWDLRSQPQFPKSVEYLLMEMNATNDLYKSGIIWKYNVDVYAIVIPKEPEQLTCEFTSGKNVELRWKTSWELADFPPGLIHWVTYQSQWEPKWIDSDMSNLAKQSETYHLPLTLSYANSNYTFMVRSRSARAEANAWSRPASISVKTLSTIPGSAPRTAMGSFETTGKLQDRNVVVFWQQIPPMMENGDGFTYSVQVYRNGLPINVKPQTLTNTYALFSGLSYESYRFIISSVNDVGESEEQSEVYVPRRDEMIGMPQAFTKIDYSGGVYELSWKPPKKDSNEVTNYTVFWCSSKTERPYPCDGYLNWTTVASDQLAVNVTMPSNQYQFAIAANSRRGSSGMIWATCTVIYNRVVSKVQDVWINGTGSRDISIGWRLDCSDRIGIIEGYRINYCPIDGTLANCTGACTEPEINQSVSGPDANGYVLSDLKPYTRYLIMLSVITRAGEGRASDPVCNTTLQAAPSDSPYHVTITNVTSESLVVSWLPPKEMNGVLDHFMVSYNDQIVKVPQNSFGNGTYSTVLEKLLGYTNYSIRVRACTVKCSRDSMPVWQRTRIGAPGIVNMPKVKFENSSMILVMWGSPSYIGAPQLSGYEIKLIARDGKENKSHVHYISGDKRLVYFPIPDCTKENSVKTYSFQVRGVNKDPNSDYPPLTGRWSAEQEGNCYAGGLKAIQILIWGGAAVGTLAILLLVGFVAGRMWRKCKEMRDVEVKLPPGLAPPEDTLGELKTSFMPEHRFDSSLLYNRLHSQCSDDDRERHMSGDTGCSMYAMDDELLLKGKEENPSRNPSGDSSGCVSGHDSVSSSLTTGTQLSTDSGTEADRHPPPSPDVFTWDAATGSPSLRLRNPSRGAGAEDCGDDAPDYIKMGLAPGNRSADDKVEVASSSSTPNLDRAGCGEDANSIVTACPTNLVAQPQRLHRDSTGYISMPSSQESIPGEGYAKVGVAPEAGSAGYSKVAPASSGYVAHPAFLPVSKAGGGYVTLGTTSANPGTTMPSVDNPPKTCHEVNSYCKVGIDDATPESADEVQDFTEIETETLPEPSPSPKHNTGYVQWKGYMPHSVVASRQGEGDSVTNTDEGTYCSAAVR